MAAPDQQRLSPAERANLVAYLDGELNEAESRAIATKLTQSKTARRELEALEKTWELLEHLPRPQPSPEFTARTLTQVKLLAQRDDQRLTVAGVAAHKIASVLVLVGSALVTLLLAYSAARWVWPDPSARLIRELSLAEHLDEYLDAGTWAFLQQLDQSPQLTGEGSHFVFDPEDLGAETNRKRLLAMPREERVALAKNLERFDTLDRNTQRDVAEIDSALVKSSREDRTRYTSLLREYHLWRQGLPEKAQKELADAKVDQKLEVIGRYRGAATEQAKAPSNEFRRVQFALMNPMPPIESAHILNIWLKLPPEKRLEVEKVRPVDRLKRMRELGAEIGLHEDAATTKEHRKAVLRHINSHPRLKKEYEAAKSQEQLKAPGNAHPAMRLAEALYFLDNPPAAVSATKLEQFDAALPPWFRDQVDTLPPEGASRRLTILYRLIYPAGEEMPEPPKTKPAPGAAGAGDALPGSSAPAACALVESLLSHRYGGVCSRERR